MKRLIKFTAEMLWECDDEWNSGRTFEKFDEIADGDYDNVDRPMQALEDLGWVIKNKKVKVIE